MPDTDRMDQDDRKNICYLKKILNYDPVKDLNSSDNMIIREYHYKNGNYSNSKIE